MHAMSEPCVILFVFTCNHICKFSPTSFHSNNLSMANMSFFSLLDIYVVSLPTLFTISVEIYNTFILKQQFDTFKQKQFNLIRITNKVCLGPCMHWLFRNSHTSWTHSCHSQILNAVTELSKPCNTIMSMNKVWSLP